MTAQPARPSVLPGEQVRILARPAQARLNRPVGQVGTVLPPGHQSAWMDDPAAEPASRVIAVQTDSGVMDATSWEKVPTLKFEGEVEMYADPDDSQGPASTVRIGGRDILAEIGRTFRAGTIVTVAIADSRYEGGLEADLGSRGWSELTPGDPASLCVGPHSLIRELDRYDGQSVTMLISSGPIDVSVEEK